MGILITSHHEKGWTIGIRERFFIKDDKKAREIAEFFITSLVEIKLEKRDEFNIIEVYNRNISLGKDYEKLRLTLLNLLAIKKDYGVDPEIGKNGHNNNNP
jgi:hypothetical protein